MYQYDDTLMDGLQLPQGMDREALLDLIWTQCGELYPYYQVPPRVKSSIGFWSARRLPQWQDMWDALQAEYNPIHNYDRYEDLKEYPNITRDLQNRGTDTNQIKNTGEDTTTLKGTDTTKQTGTDVTTTDRSAFNQTDYSPVDKVTDTPDLTTVYTPDDTTTYRPNNQSDGTYTYGSGRKETETGNRMHDNHIYGNVGVTTSQQMIESELELRKFDIYQLIVNEFEREFCSGVY